MTGLGAADPVTITKVPNQPLLANNVSPVYAPDGRILFTSDRPRDGRAHLYPQLDEYEEAPVVTGLWSLDPATGDLKLLDHAPSGDFKPTVDSFGRVVFTRWDHLQRDQQADSDYYDEVAGNPPTYGTFNWSSERADADAARDARRAVPRAARRPQRPAAAARGGAQLQPLLSLDGEPGRHRPRDAEPHRPPRAAHATSTAASTTTPTSTSSSAAATRAAASTTHEILNMLEIRESAMVPGLYFAVDAPEFYTHAAGMLFSLNGAPTDPADEMGVTWISHPGYRELHRHAGPLPLGLLPQSAAALGGERARALVAVHAGERSAGVPETRQAANDGSTAAPVARYKFRLRNLVAATAPCAGYQKYGTDADARASPRRCRTGIPTSW